MTERVILVDDDGVMTGTAPKATVHHGATPLHLAFSCYVFDPAGRLLLTRRAATKKTWPGIWTNSVCGHPLPGEDIEDSVRRRARVELGISLSALTLILPAFRYRAVMSDGTVENELCPVFRAASTDPPAPDPAEVDDIAWPDWAPFAGAVLAGASGVSPWCSLQVAELIGLGQPFDWPAGDPHRLPPAAR